MSFLFFILILLLSRLHFVFGISIKTPSSANYQTPGELISSGQVRLRRRSHLIAVRAPIDSIQLPDLNGSDEV
ncbi:unnamed protein product [Protopolystoma xenopodis]|uniref:Secreted protein n=1 Tax=Protopolystoma xenopodis TaxID=117903 RepID=A0A3S5AMM8_9PLAT|nr:unnamed protein product [Protopolystoma xenopodis]